MAVAAALVWFEPVRADEAPAYAFDIPADEVEIALKKFSRQSGRPVIAPSEFVNHVRGGDPRVIQKRNRYGRK